MDFLRLCHVINRWNRLLSLVSSNESLQWITQSWSKEFSLKIITGNGSLKATVGDGSWRLGKNNGSLILSACKGSWSLELSNRSLNRSLRIIGLSGQNELLYITPGNAS